MSSFEEATDSLSQELVDVEIKQRKYPIPDPGMYEAECLEVKLFDSPYQEGQKVMKLVLQLPQTYKDEFTNSERNFRIYSKPFSFMFGARSSLSSLCDELTGRPPFFVETKEARGDDTFIHRKFNPNQFVGMKCSILIKHANVKEKTYANIIAFMATDQQKMENCKKLPIAVKSEGEVLTTAPRIQAKKKKEAAEAVFKDLPQPPTAIQGIKNLIDATKTKKEMENLVSLLIEENTSLSDAEKGDLKTLANAHMAELQS